jgi:hypothetical protein
MCRDNLDNKIREPQHKRNRTRNSKDHLNTLLSTSLNNPMQIGSQKMGFPFLVVFQLGHKTTNQHILNIQAHIMKSPYTQQRLRRRPIWTHILALLKEEQHMMIHTWAGLQTLPRSGFKPPGFHSNPMAWEGKTSYTYDYWDKSRHVQQWRKSEHWPHT